jgi:phosphatidylinositol alpha-1,6-mannosyltransferase
MNILIISIEFPPGPGGIGTLSYQIANILTKSGWKVSVSSPQRFSTEKEIKMFNQSQRFEIQSISYKGPFLFEAIDRFIKSFTLISKRKPNIILSIGGQATWLGAILSILTNTPLASIGIGTEFVHGTKIQHWLTRNSFNQADNVVAISKYTKNLMVEFNIKESLIYVIPCGADDELFMKGLPVEYLKLKYQLDNSKVILTVGTLTKRKAQDIVIRAISLLKETIPEIKYLIVGNPVTKDELQHLAGALGVRDSIVFAGQASQVELPYLYNLADVFVLVSRQTKNGDVEGFGIVVIEAALCGTPSVVSNKSGLVETIIDGETGYIVEQENPDATADAIQELLLDDNLRKKMGEAAYRNASENSTWEKIINHYEKVLIQTVKKK